MADRIASRADAVRKSHRQLRTIVREVAVLCRQPLADDAFFPAYLQRIIAALRATEAAIWKVGADGRAVCRWQQRLPNASNLALDLNERKRLVQRAWKSRGGLIFRRAPKPGQTRAASAVYVPVRQGEETRAVIEVAQQSADEHELRDRLRFVQHMALLASDRPRPSISAANSKTISAKQLFDFAAAVHASLQLERAAYNIVNELRRFLACDRVSLVRVGGGAARLLAVSGQDSFDRRADVVRRLQTLAHDSSSAVDAIWLNRGDEATTAAPPALPPGAAEISNWQTLGIVPLRPSSDARAVGALVIEQIAAKETGRELARRTQLVLPHVAGAFVNALDHSSAPLASLQHAWRRFARADGFAWQRRAMIAAGVVAALLFLALFPARFSLHAGGTLEPSVERDVFAEVDGTVRTLHVEHGDIVQAGDVLLELHNSDLEILLAQVAGDQRATRESLAAVQRQRHDRRTPRDEHDRLASEALRLEEQLEGLDEQHALLLAKRERLAVRSPIAGQVTTWNTRELLDNRPVAVGQVLLTIADPQSPRELEIYLPEADIAHLTRAQAQSHEPLVVEYIAVAEPTATRRGTLHQIDSRAQFHDEHAHCVRLIVDIGGDAPQAPAGTTVTARIACGQRAIGYVWLHRLIGFVYTRILFQVS